MVAQPAVAPAQAALSVADLHAYYGESHILQGVNLEVPSGQLVALLGRNGVGKSTTIRAIMGLLPPRRGRVELFGENVAGLPPEKIARRGVALVPQGRGIFPNLTVYENLTLAMKPGSGPWTLERVYELFPRLRERRHNRGNKLSGGEQQLLALGRALLMNPKLLLLDEPSEGLAPLVVKEVGRVLRELKQAGLSILLVEQNLHLALSVADQVAILSKGQVVYTGDPEELRHDEKTLKLYLGV